MKTLLLTCGIWVMCLSYTHASTTYCAPATAAATPDTSLLNIQKKILAAFQTSAKSKDLGALHELRTRLEKALKDKIQLADYWLAWTYYYQSMFYLGQNDKKKAESSIKEAIQIMEQKRSKNAEDLVLLAMFQSFSIQFTSGMNAGVVSGRAKKNVQSALEMDPQNLRAHLVAGQLDYYTPAIYGGGKKAEAYFKKAISLPDQKVKNEYLPSWGKASAYAYLVVFYMEKKDMEQAKKYLKEALALYPDDRQLLELSEQVKS